MNDIELPDPPPDCKLVLERQPGFLKIHCLTLKAENSRLTLGIGVAVLCTAPLLLAAVVEGPGLLCPALLLAGGGLLAALLVGDEWRQPTTVLLTADRLAISTTGWGWSDRAVWQRSEDLHILAGATLVVSAANRTTRTYRGLRKQDLRWLAEVIVQVLELSGCTKRGDGELPIRYNHGAHESWMDGFLYAEPGCLELRYFLLDQPDYVFRFKGPIPSLELVGRNLTSLPLERHDVMCSGDEAGGATMQLMVSWWQVPLTVWCDDKDALHSALARFWGAAEE
jgi:hypothetical protein